ncbi:MSC_0621 family F1-like ATPase epsilon subunit [Mycoplasma capricolum]|uniref:MSC_0621 family F1-like ATPase epsilon subunit n=1 Tax=Mycoplasma capricolum TaxID=2095 RepID=UPI003DA60EE3
MISRYFNATINFIENKSVMKFNSCQVYFNVDQEDEWQLLNENAVLGYEILLLKLVFLDQRTKYLFVKNTNIIVNNNQITINTLSKPKFFFKTNLKKLYLQELNEVNKKVKQLETIQKIGLDISTFLQLSELKNQQYVLKMKNFFKLKEEQYESK